MSKVGFPIRKSWDQRLFAPSPSLSQRTTSFIASYRQGIHQMPLGHLIALICNAHPCSEACPCSGEKHFRNNRTFGRIKHRNRKTRSHRTNPYPDGTCAPSGPLHTPNDRAEALSPQCSWDAPTSCAGTQACSLYTMSRKPLRSATFGHSRAETVALQTWTQSRIGGACRDRTDDLKLAKLPLSQLSYGPDPNGYTL